MANLSLVKIGERKLLTWATAVSALVIGWLASLVQGPLLVADDLAYIGLGRTLAGGGAVPLPAQPPYGLLYPLFLAPGALLGLDETMMHSWGRIVNAALGAAIIPVLYFLVRRITGASVGLALAASVIAAMLPAHVVGSSIVWSERLLALLFALAVLALLRYEQHPSKARALLLCLVAIALYMGHPRLGICALVFLLAIPGLWLAKRKTPEGLLYRNNIVFSFLGLLGLGVAEGLRRLVARVAFGSTGTYDVGDLASRRGLDELPEMLTRGTGTFAYLILATAGTAIVGVYALVCSRPDSTQAKASAPRQSVVGQSIERKPRFAFSQAGMWAGVAGLGVVVVAGWFLTGPMRADVFLHGRYIEVLAPTLVALGIAALASMRKRVAVMIVAPAIVASGVWASLAGGANNWENPRSPVMMLGVEAAGAPFGNSVFQPIAVAGVGLAVFALLCLLFSRPLLGLGVAVLVLGIAIASTLTTLEALYETATLNDVEKSFAEIEIERVAIDVRSLRPNLTGAVAYYVGFERASVDFDLSELGEPQPSADGNVGNQAEFTHLLRHFEAPAPTSARLEAVVRNANLWALRQAVYSPVASPFVNCLRLEN